MSRIHCSRKIKEFKREPEPQCSRHSAVDKRPRRQCCQTSAGSTDDACLGHFGRIHREGYSTSGAGSFESDASHDCPDLQTMIAFRQLSNVGIGVLASQKTTLVVQAQVQDVSMVLNTNHSSLRKDIRFVQSGSVS